MYTLRDARQAEARLEYAKYAPEVGELRRKGKAVYYAYIDGQLIQRYTREEIGAALIRAWDRGIKTGA